jgi:predicted transcriptional regulator YheO
LQKDNKNIPNSLDQLNGNVEQLKMDLSQEDWAIIHSTKFFMQSFDELLGAECEVVLHVYDEEKKDIIIHEITNGHVTGRKVGGPLVTQNMEVFSNKQILNKDIIDSYYTRTQDGKIIKSISSIIKNPKGEPIAIFCVNLNLSAPMITWLNKMAPNALSPNSASNWERAQPNPLLGNPITAPKQTTEDSSRNQITTLIDKTIEEMATKTNIGSSNIKKDIIALLLEAGIFELKGAIEVVAEKIGLSRFTVYHYLREIKLPQ